MISINAALEKVLARIFDDFTELDSCNRLSAGANQKTYRIAMQTTAGMRLICLRRAAGGSNQSHAPGQPGLRVETSGTAT